MFWFLRGISNLTHEATFSGDIDKTKLVGSESTTTSQFRKEIAEIPNVTILKCTECGNTFKTDNAKEGEIVACPICEAAYTVQVKNGTTKIVTFIYEKEEDLGEL